MNGVSYAIDQQSEVLARGLYGISYQLSRPRLTETKSSGKSYGGAQTTTHTEMEEHTLSESDAFTTGKNWSTAWAVDSSHAADLTFNYTVKNTGTEYAREISDLIFNVYLADDTTPIISYPAWQQFPSGKLQNVFPGNSFTYASTAIALTLDQMKRIDLGDRLTVVLESYSFGSDQTFYQNAVSGGVTIFTEGGADDASEQVDSYVIPTWGAGVGTKCVDPLLPARCRCRWPDQFFVNAHLRQQCPGVARALSVRHRVVECVSVAVRCRQYRIARLACASRISLVFSLQPRLRSGWLPRSSGGGIRHRSA